MTLNIGREEAFVAFRSDLDACETKSSSSSMSIGTEVATVEEGRDGSVVVLEISLIACRTSLLEIPPLSVACLKKTKPSRVW